MDVDNEEEIFAPALVDFKMQSENVQEIRFKMNQINEVFVAYLRTVCKKSFFASLGAENKALGEARAKKILMTMPTNLYYERYVFTCYEQILLFVQDQLNKVATLEEDLALLREGNGAEPLGFQTRMVVLYRSEKKKIVRSQLNLVKKAAGILDQIEKTIKEQTDPGA